MQCEKESEFSKNETLCLCKSATARHVSFDLGDVPGTDFTNEFSNHCDEPCNCNSPIDRESEVDEEKSGDVPCLPSYKEKAYQWKEQPHRPADNLFIRGPFFKGVSETHEEFVNRGGIEPKKYHKYVRHHEESGLKYDKSITKIDFCPPYPMFIADKNPCPKEIVKDTEYQSFHNCSKDSDMKVNPKHSYNEIIYVDEVPKRDFRTETGDSYICYHMTKQSNKLKDVKREPREVFQDYLRQSHNECTANKPYHLFYDTNRCTTPNIPVRKCYCDCGNLKSKSETKKCSCMILPPLPSICK